MREDSLSMNQPAPPEPERTSCVEETMQDVFDAVQGGLSVYRVAGKQFVPSFFSDVLGLICGRDRERVMEAVCAAYDSGELLDLSCRIRQNNGDPVWIRLNGRRAAGRDKFCIVYTVMSAENRLLQQIADETADGIYVIDRETYELLYANESGRFRGEERGRVGRACYAALYGRTSPCEFCTLTSHEPDGTSHIMETGETGRFYSTHFREIDWNGRPAIVKYVRDVTEEVTNRRERERLEQYFQTVLKHLPGGIVVVHYEKDGTLKPEFISEGFADMTDMTLEDAWQLYETDALAGVHPDDRVRVNAQMEAYVGGNDRNGEIVYRLEKGSGGYVWIKNSLTMNRDSEEKRIYSVLRDMTGELEEKELIRKQYKDVILQHYHTQDSNALIVGHCNITQNRILEIIDYTGVNPLKLFGSVREEFFTGMGTLIVDEEERRKFYGIYLNEPSLAAFKRKDFEQCMECFVQIPGEATGRYVQIMMTLVDTPDSSDVTGILAITDITDQTINDRILHRLTTASHDFVVDINLTADYYRVLTQSDSILCVPPPQGNYSEWTSWVQTSGVMAPRDRERYKYNMNPEYVIKKLQSGPYSFTFSLMDQDGDIRTKSITLSPVDLRLGRICLTRTDITDSVREQQGMLRLIAYTFELAGFINLASRSLTMYTRATVLENLPPAYSECYEEAILGFIDQCITEENEAEVRARFRIHTILEGLREKPDGYDFLLSYHTDEGERYKQITVMWSDVNHSTVGLVRADVTDTLTAERKAKKALEDALALAEEANRAKSDFLSTMSHDIRTPMNAVMGMTALAIAHLGDRDRVADCLQKISISSRHLLSLINDILDMNKIERSQITLNRMKISLNELLAQLSAMMAPQARAAGLQFAVHMEDVRHKHFYGDSLRLNQILINILGNAVKYTPVGGSVEFRLTEISPVEPSANEAGRARYLFTISDTGVGMSETFLACMFEPFMRNESTERIEGTGLGLSITKGLIDLMGGRIQAESQVGRGSCFKIELEFDCLEAEEEAAAEAERKTEPGAARWNAFSLADGDTFAGCLFLVAEDNAINAEILCELLAMSGARTVVTTDGKQAVRAFMESEPHTYSAVLMDVQMPGMNGYDATRAIRSMEREDAAAIPIIAMTANAFAEDIQAAAAAGMNAHVAKPVDMAVLRETLLRALKKKTVWEAEDSDR